MPSSLTTVSDRSSFWMPVTAENSAEQPLHTLVTVSVICVLVFLTKILFETKNKLFEGSQPDTWD